MLVIKRLHPCAVHTGFRVVAFSAEKTHLKSEFCPSTWLDQAPLALFCCAYVPVTGYTVSPKVEKDSTPFKLILCLFCAAHMEKDVGLHILGIDGVMEATSSYLICRL